MDQQCKLHCVKYPLPLYVYSSIALHNNFDIQVHTNQCLQGLFQLDLGQIFTLKNQIEHIRAKKLKSNRDE